MRARLKYFAATLVLTLGLAPLLMGPTGGLPSQPTFQNVTVRMSGNVNPLIQTTTAANFAQLRIKGASTSSVGVCTSDTAAACIATTAANDSVFFGTGTLHLASASGTDLATVSTTTFNVLGVDLTPSTNPGVSMAFTTTVGCSVNGSTGTITFTRAGNIVVAFVSSGGSCSVPASTACLTFAALVPAAYRPTTQQIPQVSVQSNGASTVGRLFIASNGNLQFCTPSVSTFFTSTAGNTGGDVYTWTKF